MKIKDVVLIACKVGAAVAKELLDGDAGKQPRQKSRRSRRSKPTRQQGK